MKQLMLVGTAFLGLAGSGSAAKAVPFDFTYSGSLINFTIPTTDTYQILAFGAQGGGTAGTQGSPGSGGLGAEIGGDFSLTAGEVLQIAVGGAGIMPGSGTASGGGGGSFVVGPGNTPLVIAGGGGGSGYFFGIDGIPPSDIPGEGGLTGPNGGGGNGGTGGNGGSNGTAGGGGGFLSAGGNGFGASGGGAFPGLAGGEPGGGFGGGGGEFGGGGGGGYSGGGGGVCAHVTCNQGGGGGSFDGGTDQILVADFQTGNGEVVITEVSAAIPEPASIALLGGALLSFAAVRRRRRPET